MRNYKINDKAQDKFDRVQEALQDNTIDRWIDCIKSDTVGALDYVETLVYGDEWEISRSNYDGSHVLGILFDIPKNELIDIYYLDVDIYDNEGNFKEKITIE